MQLAYLLKKFPRLSETFILTEVLAQEALGMNLRVFSRRAPDDEPRHPELAHLKAAVEVFPKYSELDPWNMAFATGEEELGPSEWARLRTMVHEYSPFVGERFSRLLTEALYFRQRALEFKIEHVHVHFATESAIVAMLARELGGPSYSITAHAKDIYRSTVRPELLEALIQGSSFLVTVCNANVEYMLERVSPEAGARIRRLYNGLALERFPYSETGRQPAHVLSVGRLVEKKGFGVLLTALADLKRQGRSFVATIAGGGEDAELLKSMAQDLGLDADTLTFTGPVDQDAVRALMKEATVFCLPCIIGDDGNRDALPTVLLEAIAMGLPCISTPVTGIPEILDHGQAGRIVPERDAPATAAAIAELLDSPVERLELARRGRARAEELFDATQSGKTLNGWFQEAILAPATQ